MQARKNDSLGRKIRGNINQLVRYGGSDNRTRLAKISTNTDHPDRRRGSEEYPKPTNHKPISIILTVKGITLGLKTCKRQTNANRPDRSRAAKGIKLVRRTCEIRTNADRSDRSRASDYCTDQYNSSRPTPRHTGPYTATTAPYWPIHCSFPRAVRPGMHS